MFSSNFKNTKGYSVLYIAWNTEWHTFFKSVIIPYILHKKIMPHRIEFLIPRGELKRKVTFDAILEDYFCLLIYCHVYSGIYYS